MSASTTKSYNWFPAMRITSRASVALFFGRNPKLLASKSASKIGSITIFAAVCTTRSRTVGIRGTLWVRRCLPSSFPMYCRLTAEGRYWPAFRSACIPSRNCTTPCSSMDCSVVSSTPAAPRLLRTRAHALHRTSLLWIRSYNAWKRRVLLCLAHTYSSRWSSRTLSTNIGLFPVSGMPSRLPLRPLDQSRVPFLQRVVLRAFPGVGSEVARLRASHRPPLKLYVQFSRIQLSRRLALPRCNRRDQLNQVHQPVLAIQLGFRQLSPATVPPPLESMRPNAPHYPAVEPVEELSDVGSLVVMAPSPQPRVQSLN